MKVLIIPKNNFNIQQTASAAVYEQLKEDPANNTSAQSIFAHVLYLCQQQDGCHPRTLPFHFELTSRGQAAAYGSVEAGLTDTGVRVQHTAQLDVAQTGYLSMAAPFILKWQFVTV